ncbi:MAG: DNA2/NAM7 family helicase, partial [Rudanella sp.]|nr:DNA2/NAM7 family helicase [Rudanella sp.]
LFNTAECGVSAKELYLSSNPSAETIALEDVYEQFPLANADNFMQRLTNYAGYQQRVGMGHPWHDRVLFDRFSTADQFVIDRAVTDVGNVAKQADSVATEQLRERLLPAEWSRWNESAWTLEALLSLLTGENSRSLWSAVQFLRTSPNHPANTIAEGELLRLAALWQEALASPGPLSYRPVEPPSSLTSLIVSALEARNSFISWNWWQLTNPGKDQLRQVAQKNGLTISANDLRTLRVRLEKSQMLEELKPQTDALLTGLALPNEPATLRLLQQARELTARTADLPVLATLPAEAWVSAPTFTETTRALLAQAATVSEALPNWQPYLTNTQTDAIWTDENHANALRKSLRNDFDLLIENDRIRAGFSEAERTASQRLAGKAEPVALFMNSLRISWINHLEKEFPDLRNVSSLKMSQQEAALQDSIQKKQQLSRDILGMHLRQQTYRNLAFNRLNNLTTYRDLLHQTTKKRNVWPVRRLMSQFADEVFRLVPCWMASPESVSAIFPLQEGLFDLVIFDEASQCFAENGVPAMFRGKQVIITGDSQQLRPSDLYRTRIEDENLDEETDQTALEVESLLELAAQSLPQVSLTGHYRSRSMDLIQFSNDHFYANKLTLLPDRQILNQHIPAIRYQLMPGVWQQNTNPVEAEAVLHLVEQLATDMPGRSIGVVTFNFPQQQLIQELLEDTDKPVAFVKNIENVQGDECDVIIFSVGYAPDEKGRLAMQFGSLNMVGGANRLNVAVTRARERVYVITSLRPEQLTVDNVANEGPRLLKAYLSYAQQVSEGHFRPQPRRTEAGLGSVRGATWLKNQLAAQHPNWQPELPVADLTIREGNQYAGLVMTDDDQYYAQTIKESHALLPFALRNKQWPFERHWSREFWKGE